MNKGINNGIIVKNRRMILNQSTLN